MVKTKRKQACSLCRQSGHNKRTCKTPVAVAKPPATTAVKPVVQPAVKPTVKPVAAKPMVKPVVPPTAGGKETQKHGFVWEKEIITKVYGATTEDVVKIGYTGEHDLPAEFNKLGKFNLSVKTSQSPNCVCMADWKRVFDISNEKTPFHLAVINYKQVDKHKHVTGIIEVDLTNSRDLLFGRLTKREIMELDAKIREVPKAAFAAKGRNGETTVPAPQKKKPTAAQKLEITALQNELQKKSGAIYLNVKCSRSQSRLQCSLNRFLDFVKNNPGRVVARSNSNKFRGGEITAVIESERRKFR